MSTSDVGWNLTLLFKSLLWNIGRKKYGWFWWFTSTWSSSIATLNKQRVIHLDPSQTYNLRQVVDWERLSKVKALIGLIGIGKAWISRHVDRCWPFVWVFCKPFCRTEFDDETTSGIIRDHPGTPEMSHRKHRIMHLKSMLANTSRPIIDDHLIFFFNSGFVKIGWLIGRASKSHFIPKSEFKMQTFWGHLNVPSENCGCLALPGQNHVPNLSLRPCFYTPKWNV